MQAFGGTCPMCCGDMVEAAGATVCIYCGATCDESRPAGRQFRATHSFSDRAVPAPSGEPAGHQGAMKVLASELMGRVRTAPGDVVPALARSLETARTLAVEGLSPQPTSGEPFLVAGSADLTNQAEA